MSIPSHIAVRVPATSANLGHGFDCLGLALGLYSTFEVEILSVNESDSSALPIEILSTWGSDPAISALPTQQQNLFYQAFLAQLKTRHAPLPTAKIRITAGMPPGRGLGSSATAVVGGLLAAEAILGNIPRQDQRRDLLHSAIALEPGQHPDNVAAALLGGLVVTAKDQRGGSWQAIPAPIPPELRAILFVPTFPMDTIAGRRLLPAHYSRDDAVHNLGHVALLVGALATGDMKALDVAMDDRFHEPYRMQLFPQLPSLIAAARQAGAHGACLSGGGSTILAFATQHAQDIAQALAAHAKELGIDGRALVAEISHCGATVEISPVANKQISLSCPDCERRFPLDRIEYRCVCGQPLDVALNDSSSESDGLGWQKLFDRRRSSLEPIDQSGVWRFRELLMPLQQGITPITRPEGQTNLYPVGQAQTQGGYGRIGAFVNLDQLWLKHEGENPTGSFKDRGMTLGVSVAKWLGATTVACASTGNTSASMAAYGAQAGLRAIVLLPQGKVASGKLAQAVGYGAEIHEITGDFDRAMLEVEHLALEEGIYLLNSLNPFRILGQQSLAFELMQQLHWEAPDWIILPAGNLGNTSAIGMGILRAYRLGIISKLPRIAAIQASGANPFYLSYLGRFLDFHPVRAQTIATAINIGNPVSYMRARSIIKSTNGMVAQVTDEEILCAKAVIDCAGIGCEPASAAAVAGARQLVARGIIAQQDRVVAVLTGNLLKDTDAIRLAQETARRSSACLS